MENRTYELRGVIVALASFLPKYFTFNQLADFLFRGGMLASPEKPYPDYPGNKADYIKERLASATGTEDFFTRVLPEMFDLIDDEFCAPAAEGVVRSLEKFGYVIEHRVYKDEERGLDAEWWELVPPTRAQAPTYPAGQRIDSDGLPTYLSSLAHQLNENLAHSNSDASALLIRRIIFVASVIYLKKQSKEQTAINGDGDYYPLSTILELVSQEAPDVSQQLLARLKIAKWMGDDANHVLRWKASQLEVEQASAITNRFLRALFA